MPTQSQNLQIPDNLQNKMGLIVVFIIIIILIWLNNTGRMQALISAFQQAGENISNGNINAPIDNPISPAPVTIGPAYPPYSGPANPIVPSAPPLPGAGSGSVPRGNGGKGLGQTLQTWGPGKVGVLPGF